ncbi:hypothetical protein [Bradyrhizobium sp. AUGA SZCCT0182]|uniref:hypothetical protein n=1 Tax=Bradyrhizobium sp. AUGA SZCCT0182 TaxID=2807667 RepID=UPI001BA90C78|nr:hypothetical protein [Bradyrhizobium sp. AUGA SZCCT0182]MBR1232590.1 hypothetical protein [Bradyrhizobium sp. AUGA SZCCT0182]
MTRAAIVAGDGSALTSDERLKIQSAIKDFLRPPEHRHQLLLRLEEAVAVERQLVGPSRAEDRKRPTKLEELEQAAKGLLNAMKGLDDDTLSQLRQQSAFDWLASIAQFERLISDLKMTTEALSKSATAILNRDSKSGRNENTALVPRSFLIQVLLVYYEVVGEKPPYSKGSNFIRLANAILDALQMPTVGEDRLKVAIDALVASGELPSSRVKRGPKPHAAE